MPTHSSRVRRTVLVEPGATRSIIACRRDIAHYAVLWSVYCVRIENDHLFAISTPGQTKTSEPIKAETSIIDCVDVGLTSVPRVINVGSGVAFPHVGEVVEYRIIIFSWTHAQPI
jgi:hypothetical protein